MAEAGVAPADELVVFDDVLETGGVQNEDFFEDPARLRVES